MIDYEKKKISNTQIDLVINISKDDLKNEYNKEVIKLSKEVEMKGFRKGNVPKDIAEASVSAKAQRLALENIIPKYASDILKKENIIPAAPLSYEIESVDVKKGARIKAIVPVVPEFNFPNIDDIKVKKESSSVSDKEVDDVLDSLWKQHRDKAENKDDKWVEGLSKKLGFSSKKLGDLRIELKNSIKSEKEKIIIQKYQSDLLAKAVELAKIEIPEAMVYVEAHAREDSFNSQVQSMKVTPQQFCQIRGVTMEQLRQQWYKDSQEALKNDLLLSKYASIKKISVSKDELEMEIDRIKKQSPGTDSSLFDNLQWKNYIQRVILKRKAFQSFLKEVDPKTSDK